MIVLLAGWVEQLQSLLETVPAEHRQLPLVVAIAAAAWILHARFGKDRVAVAQRDAAARAVGGFTEAERADLRELLDTHRRAQKLAAEWEAEREEEPARTMRKFFGQ